MIISLTSLITLVICTSVAMAIIVCLCSDGLIGKVGIYSLLAVFLVVMVRFFIPFELPFAISVPLGGAYAVVVQFLRRTFPIGGFQSSLGELLILGWLGISVILTIRTISVNLHFDREVKRKATLITDDTLSILEEVMAEHDHRGKVFLYRSPMVSIPFAAGLFHLSIFLPDYGLTDDELKHIIRHELTHYRNGDLWIKLFLEAMVLLYWWNPIVYLFRKQISIAMEMRVDVTVAKPLLEDDRVDYFLAILKVAKLNKQRDAYRQQFILMADGRNNDSTLKRRKNMVCDASDESLAYNTKKSKPMVFVAMAVILLSCSFVFEPYFITSDAIEVSYVLKDDSSYVVINEDGFYDLYVDNTFVGYFEEIHESFGNLRIYENGKAVIQE